jgi:hypothetical protein
LKGGKTVHPDRIAKAAGWLIIETGEVYEKQYHHSEWWQKEEVDNKEVFVLKSRHASLFIFREGRSWVLWRGSFRSDQAEPISERTLGKSHDLRKMIARGEDFITWWENRNKKGQSKKTAQKRLAR